MNITIDKEFRDLIPPLSDGERNQLEENILRDGIQDPLKIWSGFLIDEHNRYEIAAWKRDFALGKTQSNIKEARNEPEHCRIAHQAQKRPFQSCDRIAQQNQDRRISR